MCAVRHAQITQNKKFVISLHYFLHAGKHENLLQIDTRILMEMVRHFQSSQNSKFAMSSWYLKKEVRDESDFLHADKHENGLQVDFNTLGTKISYKVMLSLLMSMMKHSQITQSNKFMGMEFILCMQINIKSL